MHRRLVALAVVLTLSLLVVWVRPARVAGQEPGAATADSSQQPTFRTGIDFVRVDVIVTERGRPVMDLTEDDFEVREDGREQSIEQFRLVSVERAPVDAGPPRPIRGRDDEEREAARDDVRVMVFFLDDYHTRFQSSVMVKAQLIEFIQTQLRPTDMIAVMTPLSSASELSFTRNHAQVIAAINAFEGRKFRYQPRNQFEQQYTQQPAEVVEMLRNQVVMGALRGLSVRLGSVREGRKSVVFVSEGFTVTLPPQMRNQNAEMLGGLPTGIAPGAGDNNPREDTARAFATADMAMRLRDVYDAANRNNVAIYSLDPRGLAATEFSVDENVGPQQDRLALRATQDSLRMLSENTAGRAIVGRNDLAQGLTQVVQDSNAYYLIGYTSSAPTDGKFHEIQVSVKRRGLDVRSRRGFWAATDADIEAATRALTPVAGPSRAVETALATLTPAIRTNQYVRTWIGATRGENGRTKMTLVWEPVTGTPGARREVPGRVSVIAARESGELLFRGRSAAPAASVSPSAPVGRAAPPPAVATGPNRLEFEAPPGVMELRLAIEAVDGEIIDNEIRTLTVPDLTTARTSIGTPRVFRARTAREFQALVEDAAAVPAASREFSRAERVLLRFDAYGAGGEVPSVTAALLNRSGQKVLDVPVAAAMAGGTHQIDLALNQVASGEYLVEITLGATGDGDEVKELVALRIGS